MSIDLSVYLVTDSDQVAATGRDITAFVLAAVAGGVTTVQVREKRAPAAAFLGTVIALADALPAHVSLIVNDRVDVFLAARAAGHRLAGVHVGQSDLPLDAVRALVGPDAVIGVSASTPAQLRAAAGADYVGIGALHATRTKTDAPPALGHDAFAALVPHSPVPVVAIGGVTAADLPLLRRAGAAGGAVVSAICRAEDPTAAARNLRAAWEDGAPARSAMPEPRAASYDATPSASAPPAGTRGTAVHP